MSDEVWLAGHDADGIALSGGGIRAASFALGVLQVLQEQRGLLRGQAAARWMTAVSGGSYIAGAVTLINAGSRAQFISADRPVGAVDLASGQFPYQPGSPELTNLFAHTRYLIEKGSLIALATIAWGVFSGIALALVVISGITAYTVLFLWLLGFGLQAGADEAGWSLMEPPDDWGFWICLLALAVIVAVMLRPTRADGKARWLELVITAVAIAAAAWTGAAFARTLRTLLHDDALIWLDRSSTGLSIAAVSLVVATAALFALGYVFRVSAVRGIALAIVGAVLRVAPIVAGVWLGAWIATSVPDWVRVMGPLLASTDEDGAWLGAVIIGFTIIGVAFLVMALFEYPLSVPYRRALARAFVSVRNAAGGVDRLPRDAEAIAISSLVPGPFDLNDYRFQSEQSRLLAFPPKSDPLADVFAESPANPPSEAGGPPSDASVASTQARAADPWVRYPELVVCAAANVRDVGRVPADSPALSMTLDGRALSIPLLQQTYPMLDVERRCKGQVGLAGAMAMSGAAVSPSMGRRTIGMIRTVLLTFGIRLGVWLPNPASMSMQKEYEGKDRWDPWAGIDGYVAELLGLHRLASRRIYVTDGGHFDNLGLVELLRKRCREVWVVDAEPDPRGECLQLARSIGYAQIELGCSVELDWSEARAIGGYHELGQTHVIGSVRFEDGHRTILNVVKLGLHRDSSAQLKAYATVDKSYPFHSTIRQVYSADRFNAYVQLGRQAATRLLQDKSEAGTNA